jgi:putative transcriptional regulator
VPATPPIVGLCAGAVAGLLSLAPPAGQVPPLREPVTRAAVEALGAGKLLVAARRLPDPNFANTVVLLTDVTKDGAVGLVLNRRSRVTLARVFPQFVPTVAATSHAFLGGPVDTTRTMALVRAAQAPAGGRRVVGDVYLATARESVEAAVAAGGAATGLRVYLGYAGWGAGQLAAETQQGVWHVLEADADLVFDADPSSLWQRQIARTALIQARRQRIDGVETRAAAGGTQLRVPPSADSLAASAASTVTHAVPRLPPGASPDTW